MARSAFFGSQISSGPSKPSEQSPQVIPSDDLLFGIQVSDWQRGHQ
jgi:hypothetical protein